ncbi:MAG: hypothetical protein ACE5DK_00380 [Paracoccaceae bacterium]
MSGFEIAGLLIGIVCGNLGAVVVKPFNLGLWWNSVCGAAGAAGYLYLPAIAAVRPSGFWVYDFLGAAGGGLGLMMVAGALVALWYRG